MRLPLALALLLTAASAAAAPAAAQASPEEMRARWEAHRGDFDYLLGDWEFTAENPEYERFHGVWSAVRLPSGQILDEYRVTGDSGETYYVTTTIRSYNAALDQWELVGMDAGGGLQDTGTGRRSGSEVHIEQTFGVARGQPSRWRIRYHSIEPDRFSWVAARSTDGGATWTPEYQKIEARRIGPARSMDPLTVPRKVTPRSP
jgi:hypothetical protein